MNKNSIIKIMAMERIEALSVSRKKLAETYLENSDMVEKKILSEYYSEIESAIEKALDAEVKYLSTLS